jgi:hypothetical protein
MKRTVYITMGILGSLFGIKPSVAQNSHIELGGQDIQVTNSPYSADLSAISDLSFEETKQIEAILLRSRIFIAKYAVVPTSVSPYASEILDKVLIAWREDRSVTKERQEEVIEMVGCAFGQGIVEELEYEWKMITDVYGTDHSVVDKRFVIHGFPFSTVLKAIEDGRGDGALSGVKLFLKKNSMDAASGAVAFKKR